MTMHFRDVAHQAMADGAISAEDVLNLRRAGWADGRVNPDEAEAIFAINHQLTVPCPEWSEFFVEAIGEYVVNQLEPRGYVTEDQGRWLIDQIEHDGHLCALTELDLVVRVFEKASDAPEALRVFALDQIEKAVLTGEGPTRCGGMLEKGNVTATEARIMRRILFSSGSERPAAISRREAELLFRIKDATLGAANDPEWKRLFVQGVGNYLQGFTGHTAISRERAGQLEALMNDTGSSVGAFMGRVARAVGTPNRAGKVFGRKAASPVLDELVEQARQVTGEEQAWLDRQIDANGEIDEYDAALLDFLAEA